MGNAVSSREVCWTFQESKGEVMRGLVLNVNYGSHETYSTSWYVLKVEPTGFAETSDVRCVRENSQGWLQDV